MYTTDTVYVAAENITSAYILYIGTIQGVPR